MYIVIDIGGTNIRLAGSRDLKTLSEPIIFATPKEYEGTIEHIAELALQVADGEPIEALAGGVPRLSHDMRTILPPCEWSNIPAWEGKPIASDLEKLLNTRAYFCNDASLVGLGEAVCGAGVGAKIVVYMTVSTGVNGVRIVDGALEPSAFSYSIGDQYISMDEPVRPLEKMISGRSLEERYGMHASELGKEHAVWEELARTTAFGVHNTILHWTPQRVVLGGSMFNEIGIPVDRVTFHLKTITKTEIPEIVHSSLGAIGGLYGGLVLLTQRS